MAFGMLVDTTPLVQHLRRERGSDTGNRCRNLERAMWSSRLRWCKLHLVVLPGELVFGVRVDWWMEPLMPFWTQTLALIRRLTLVNPVTSVSSVPKIPP